MKEDRNRTIKIIPIGGTKFSGLASIPNTFTTIGAEIGGSGTKTGLTPEEEKSLEAELGLAPGTLKKNSTWWGTDFEIRLKNDQPTYFNLQDAWSFLRYKVMKESSKVCNSPREKAKWAKADFMIEDETADAEIISTQLDLKFEAIKVLMDTTPEEKRGYLRLYGYKGVGNLKETMVKAELSKKVENDPAQFLKFINDKEIQTKILLEELIEAGVIKKHGNYYKNGDDPIGNSTEEVVGYLNDPKNSSIRLALESKVRKKKKENAE